MDSRKLMGTCMAIIAIVAVYALNAFNTIDKEVTLMAVGAITGLGGFQVYRQALLDQNGTKEKK